MLFAGGCSRRDTSGITEQVTIYKDECVIHDSCERFVEVTAEVCVNSALYPADVMNKNLHEKAFAEYSADVL